MLCKERCENIVTLGINWWLQKIGDFEISSVVRDPQTFWWLNPSPNMDKDFVIKQMIEDFTKRLWWKINERSCYNNIYLALDKEFTLYWDYHQYLYTKPLDIKNIDPSIFHIQMYIGYKDDKFTVEILDCINTDNEYEMVVEI